MANTTTRKQMQELVEGDVFYVNGEKHTVSVDSHLSGDASCDEYIVYDENDEGWLSPISRMKYSIITAFML